MRQDEIKPSVDKALTEKGLVQCLTVHNDWVLCEVPKPETKVAGTTLDLQLPADIIEANKNELSSRWLYTVVGVGHTCTNVKVGDKIFIPMAVMNYVDPQSKELIFIKEGDIMGSIQKEPFELTNPLPAMKLFTKEEAINAAKGKNLLDLYEEE